MIVFKYHGGLHRGAWPHIPARDLTKEDLKRIKDSHGITIKDVEQTGLYTKVKKEVKSDG